MAGKKPVDAELRAQQPGSYVPALQLGAGRYGEPFLQAIDWALQTDISQRPQSVAELRRALCTDHMARLDLQEALRDAERLHAGPLNLALLARLRTRAERFFSKLLHPPAWRLAAKMTERAARAAEVARQAGLDTAKVPSLATS